MPSSSLFDSQQSHNFFRVKIINVAEVNQRAWLKESGQWLESVDRSHLVLASGKLQLQKSPESPFFLPPGHLAAVEGGCAFFLRHRQEDGVFSGPLPGTFLSVPNIESR